MIEISAVSVSIAFVSKNELSTFMSVWMSRDNFKTKSILQLNEKIAQEASDESVSHLFSVFQPVYLIIFLNLLSS